MRAVKPRRTLFYLFVQTLARRVVFGLLGGIRVKGLENVPAEGPVLVAPVHMSFLDPPAVGCLMPRMTHFMAKEELFKTPVLGFLIRHLGTFPVKRGENDAGAIRLAIEILKEGRALIVFPEGTRGDSVTLGPVQPGIAMLAKRSGAQVVPVGICGTHKMLPKGQGRPRRARVNVVFGQPFGYADAAVPGNEKASREAFAAELRRRLSAACAEAGLPLKTGE